MVEDVVQLGEDVLVLQVGQVTGAGIEDGAGHVVIDTQAAGHGA